MLLIRAWVMCGQSYILLVNLWPLFDPSPFFDSPNFSALSSTVVFNG